MEDGHNAAFEERWRDAIESYSRAIQVQPEDPDAHLNLAMVLLNSSQLDRALRAYRKASSLAPEDPVPLEGIADALERMGQLKEAAQQYVKVAEAYLAQKDWDKAIGNWERATQLTPGLVGVHARLAQAYERLGYNKKAVYEYLTLAYNFWRLKQVDKAMQVVDRALRLDKNNIDALNMLQALKTGSDDIKPPPGLREGGRPKTGELPAPEAAAPPAASDDPLGPLGEALTEALEMLAAFVVESGLSDFIIPAMQGMEYQRQSLHKQAADAYRQADKDGLKHPSLKMNLGGLLVLTEQWPEAVRHLGEAITHPRLSAGALHALGQSYFKLGDQRNAAKYLVRCLQAVDASQTTDTLEVNEMMEFYDRLTTIMEGSSAEKLSASNERSLNLLSGRDWKNRVAETRRQMMETSGSDDKTLSETWAAKGSDSLAESVSFIDRYIRQGLYTLAMDECQRAIEKSPFYLPVHVRMAEILMKEGRIRQAINKYNMVAKAYLVREENDRAAAILGTVLDMAPLDVEVRMNLIQLLEGENRLEEALDQYIDLANTYQQLGDFDRCNQTFAAAERMARRINAPSSKLVQIKHSLAELNQMRLNTRQAQKIFEEILELDSSDEKALRGLTDIYYTQGNQVEAVKRLDTLLGIYARKGMVNKIRSMLEELVRNMPADTALRSRLAQIYRKLNMVKEAIEQLDALGELQLDAGLNKEAAATIRQIISLKPDRIEDYKKLLAQLNG